MHMFMFPCSMRESFLFSLSLALSKDFFILNAFIYHVFFKMFVCHLCACQVMAHFRFAQDSQPQMSIEIQTPLPGSWYASGDPTGIPLHVKVLGGGGDLHSSGHQVRLHYVCICV